MIEMSLAERMPERVKLATSSTHGYDRYLEVEGLCKLETIPQAIVQGAFGGLSFVSTPRQCCLRRQITNDG